MSFVKIWVHAVWSTKHRQALLEKEFRNDVFKHIHSNGLEKGILMEVVNGHKDHTHCLFRLRHDQTIMKTIQLLKGESSHWINQQGFINEDLKWQSEYFAVSVSESQVHTVRRYIENQEEHHKKKTFSQEYQEFMTKYNFQIFKS